MMKQSVFDASFVNMTTFGIIDIKAMISTVSVSFVNKVIVQFLYVVKQISSKFLYIYFT